jgi:hypothetical protein
LQENLIAVGRVWVLAKADQYAALRASQRGDFLDDLLTLVDAVEAMGRSMARRGPPDVSKFPPIKLDGQAKAGGRTVLLTLLARLQEGTTAEEQNKAAALVYALMDRRQSRAKQPGKAPRSGS